MWTVWTVAATSLHDDVFLDSKERHGRTPHHAFDFSDWEWLRVPEVSICLERHRVGWVPLMGAMEVQSVLLGKNAARYEGFDYRAGENEDLAKALERVSLPVVWAWTTHINFPMKILRVLCGHFEHQRRVHFEGCVAEPLQTITAFLPWVEVELFASSHCVARCSE